MTAKVTYYFGMGSQGWSLNLYNTAINTLPATNVLPLQVANLGNAVFNAMVAGANWLGTRITLVGGNRMSWQQIKAQTVKGDLATEYSGTAALVICKAQNGQSTRQFWLHAMPSGDSQFGGQVWVPANDTLSALNGISSTLTGGNGWALRTVPSKTTGPIAVGSIAPNVTNGSVQLTAPGLNPVQGSPYIVGGFKYPLQRLNGYYPWPNGWYAIGAGSIGLNNRFCSTQEAAEYVGGGTVRLGTPSYNPINFTTVEFVRQRKPGRAFFVPRGRRSSK